MKAKLIVIEGIDGAGKTAQTKLLIQRLRQSGKKVKTIHFPQHGNDVFGNLVDLYLNNKFGPAPKLDYRLASTLYALDRFEAKDKINGWLKQGYFVVLDRYAESNFAHQGGKIKNQVQRLKVIKWLHGLDYKVLDNPKPDLVLFLDVPPKFSISLMSKMGKKKDGHEKDRNYLLSTYQTYLLAAKKFNYWHTIKCSQGNSLLTIKEVHDKIWKRINK